MRILAIGDIHGCATALDTLLAAVELQPDDTLVTLGDYVDRGPNTRGVLDRLIALSKSHYVVALRGNHEQMLLQVHANRAFLSNWIENGGDATLASYGDITAIPPAHWDFLENQCLLYWEAESHFFVHANVYPDVPLFEQSDYKMLWGKFDNPLPHQSGKIMVCGHTSQKSGFPRNIGHAVCIDTWACGTGWLSCLDITTGLIWQADQQEQTRQLHLDV